MFFSSRVLLYTHFIIIIVIIIYLIKTSLAKPKFFVLVLCTKYFVSKIILHCKQFPENYPREMNENTGTPQLIFAFKVVF